MSMSLVPRLPREMHLCGSSSNAPRLPMLLAMLQNRHILLTFDKVQHPLRLPRKTTSERPKVLRTHQLFAVLTWTCASRHNRVHFFNISTSKSAPRMVCFVHFLLTSNCAWDHNGILFQCLNFQKCFEMCFVPQRRAIVHLPWPDGSAPAALASLLFHPPGPQVIGKTQ